MKTDREFLMWIHSRLVEVHGENDCIDYMHKLRAIIRSIPKDKMTPNINSCNSLKELQDELNTEKCICIGFFQPSNCPIHG